MKKILLVGGSEPHRILLQAALEEAGHKASAAVTRKYTNRWLGRRIKPFDLIIYDLEEADQPDEFWLELREAAGATPIIILTSAADTRDYAALGMNQILRRPQTIGDVVKAASQA